MDMIKESTNGIEDRDRHQFRRWETCLPCTVEWGDTTVRGRLANLSLGGALITRMNPVPPEGTPVFLTFQPDGGEFRLKGKLVSRVVHVSLEAMEDLNFGSFGVEFEEPPEEVKVQLGFGTLLAPEAINLSPYKILSSSVPGPATTTLASEMFPI